MTNMGTDISFGIFQQFPTHSYEFMSAFYPVRRSLEPTGKFSRLIFFFHIREHRCHGAIFGLSGKGLGRNPTNSKQKPRNIISLVI